MLYSLDTTLEGEQCEMNFRNETVKCTVLSAFEHTNNKIGASRIRYRLEGQDGVIYDNVLPSEIKFLNQKVKLSARKQLHNKP